MITVELKTKDKLLDDEQDYACYDDYIMYLVIRHDGKLVRVECDGMEPEDARFYRSLSWVSKAIREAYELGLHDGVSNVKEE